MSKIVFRPNIYAALKLSLSMCLIGGIVLFLGIFAKDDFQFHYKMINAVLIFEVILVPFTSLIMFTWYFDGKIVIDDNQISSRNPFNYELETLKISEIVSITTYKVLGFKYYALMSKDGEFVSVPIKLNRTTEFKNVIKQSTGNSQLFENI